MQRVHFIATIFAIFGVTQKRKFTKLNETKAIISKLKSNQFSVKLQYYKETITCKYPNLITELLNIFFLKLSFNSFPKKLKKINK